MTWRELPPLTTGLADQLPELREVAFAAGRVEDYAAELWPEERPALERAAATRVREFSTGRYLARCAMAELGAPPAAIPRGEDRRPLWPDGLLGSITHARDLAVAAVASPGSLTGLGVDLERVDRVTPNLHRKLFTAGEVARAGEVDARVGGVLFSAKESGYKAVNPRVGRFIGFLEAEVDLCWSRRQFRLRYVGDHAPNRIMERGIGYFGFFEHHVLTVFIIPE